jgi:hypothetical protein
MAYQVLNGMTDEVHGMFDTLSEARGCVAFDKIQASYEIRTVDDDGNFLQRIEYRDDSTYTDSENIYNLPSMRQSIEEDRRR